MLIVHERTVEGPPPELLSIANCTKYFGASRSQIYRWLRSGAIEGRKIGRATYIVVASLRHVLDNLPRYGTRGSA